MEDTTFLFSTVDILKNISPSGPISLTFNERSFLCLFFFQISLTTVEEFLTMSIEFSIIFKPLSKLFYVVTDKIFFKMIALDYYEIIFYQHHCFIIIFLMYIFFLFYFLHHFFYYFYLLSCISIKHFFTKLCV